MKILLSADSCVDLPKDLLDKYNIKTLPFSVTLGEKVCFDNQIKEEELFSFADETGLYPKTSAVNQYQYEQFFLENSSKYDAIIHICISSKISSAYQNAINASKEFKNIYIIDSLSVSSGMAVLALKAIDLIGENKSIDEIVKTLNETTQRVVFEFLVNNLNYIYKGGRCSALEKIASLIFKVKPAIRMHKDGAMNNYNKYIGKNSSCTEEFFDDATTDYPNADKKYVVIAYTPECTDTMIEIAKTKLLDAGFENVFVATCSSTVCCHGGPKTITVGFIN